MFSLIISIIALGLIIAFHEFGHFLAAKLSGVGVIEFSIGMGPRLLSVVKGATRYSLRWLPLGGSCMMLGEEMEEIEGEASSDLTNGKTEHETVLIREDEIVVDGRYYSKSAQFVNKSAWKRLIIIAAGPICNFILAFVLSLVITGMYGFDKPIITDIAPGMPVAEAGLEADDVIYALQTGSAKMTVESARDISIFMTVHQDAMDRADSFILFYKDASDGMRKKQAEVKPVWDNDNQVNRLGFSYSLGYRQIESIPEIIKYSICNVKYCIRTVLESLRMIFRGRVGREDVMGPVRMVAIMDETVDEAADYGVGAALISLFDMMILISGSLGCMNLLPLPALDGGRLVFILIELVSGHAVPKELEARVHIFGMLVLLMLMCFILTNDISMLLFR